MQQVSVKNLRFGLFVTLLVLAPLSKYPSIALPAFNFSSFRLGLYQLLAALFVLMCIVPAVKITKQLLSQNKAAVISLGTLSIVAVIGLFGAYYKARSGLLVMSILLLTALVVSAWWYVRFDLAKSQQAIIIKYLLIAGIVFSIMGFGQFIYSSISHDTLGVLCKGCGGEVFGFPRINGLAAEPQFFANAMLPFLFVALGVFYKQRSRLAASTLALVSLTIGLTFSRGAFFAIAGAVVFFVIILATAKMIKIKSMSLSLGIMLIAVFVSFAMLVGSASYRYNNLPNITYNTVKTMVNHLSLGVINLPEKSQVTVVTTKSAVVITPITGPTITVGVAATPANTPIANNVVQASSQERLDAAKLALTAWQSNVKTIIIGVGAGNLGPFVITKVDANAPNNLTVYIYYVLLLAELGLLGLLAFVSLFVSTFIALHFAFWRHGKELIYVITAALLTAFLLQYIFFGSYINVMYIWLWLGIGLGLAGLPLKKGYNQTKL